MGKIHCFVLALAVFTIQSAVSQSEDAIRQRVARSPCHSCGNGEPPPPPGLFRAHQWSGLARNGNQHGVFSGAAAAIGGGSQASGEALSLATTVDHGQAFLKGSSMNGPPLVGNSAGSGYARAGSQSSSSSQSSGFGRQSGSTAGSNAQSGSFQGDQSGFNGQSLNGDGAPTSTGYGSSLGHGGSSQSKFGYQEFHSSQNGKIDDIGHISSDFSSHGYNGFDKNSAGYGHGGQQSAALSGTEQQSAGSGGNQQSGGFDGGQQQSTGFGSNQQQSSGFGSSEQNSSGYGSGQQQSVGFGSGSSFDSSTASNSAAQSGGYGGADKNSGFDAGYYKSHSALNGALKLASEGLETAGQNAGCSTCGKGSYAFSNAKSDSGNAIALSVTG